MDVHFGCDGWSAMSIQVSQDIGVATPVVSELITRDECIQYVHEQVFKLRPKNYCRDYPKWPGLIGLEIEMQPWLASTLATSRPALISLHNQGNEEGLASLLLTLAQEQQWQPNFIEAEGTAEARLLNIEVPSYGMLSFEPGGQLEFSSLPFPCLAEAQQAVTRVQDILDRYLALHDVKLMQQGINPWQTVDDIGLQMTKSRYVAMDRYFNGIGSFGRRMMRQTCTMQVNLDFGGNEETLAKRYVAANLIAPFATALFANSPYVNRQASGLKSARAEAWRYIDNARTGAFPVNTIIKSWSRAACAQAYVEKVLRAPVIFIEALDYEQPRDYFSFEDWLTTPYKGVGPTLHDFQTHLSLFFPEVRARGFMELRSMDCPSRVWQNVPGLFYSSLLYDDQCVEEVTARLSPHASLMSELLHVAGHDGLADLRIGDHAEWLMELSLSAATRLPSCFYNAGIKRDLTAYFHHFSQRRRTPADDIIDAVAKGEVFT